MILCEWFVGARRRLQDVREGLFAKVTLNSISSLTKITSNLAPCAFFSQTTTSFFNNFHQAAIFLVHWQNEQMSYTFCFLRVNNFQFLLSFIRQRFSWFVMSLAQHLQNKSLFCEWKWKHFPGASPRTPPLHQHPDQLRNERPCQKAKRPKKISEVWTFPTKYCNYSQHSLFAYSSMTKHNTPPSRTSSQR